MQDTISHNVANVNTPGYSRQEVSLETMPPLNGATPLRNSATAGSGVVVNDVRRSASSLLTRQIAQEGGLLGQWEVLRDGTAEVAKLFSEPGDKGLEGMLDNFWQSWRDLSTNPTSMAGRTNVLDAGERVATALSRTALGVSDFVVRLENQYRQKVDRVNELASEMLIINHEVMQALANGNLANDLRDRRDVVLAELSRLAQIKSAENKDGSTDVMLDGHILVNANNVAVLRVAPVPSGGVEAVWADNGRAARTGVGEMSAVGELRAWATSEVMQGLNSVAAQIVDEVNARHQAGFDLNGHSGWTFFAGNSAATIALSDDVAGYPDRLATAAAAGAPADGSVALEMAGLAQKKLAGLNDSIGGSYAVLVGQVGLSAEKSDQMSSHQDELLRFLNGRKQEIAGVSLDDEAVRMMSAQRAYQAAARVITTVDQMLDKLINDTGMVGR
jgi:flagellar hook-associated protein 1 FlgK